MKAKKIDLYLLTDPKNIRPFFTGIYHLQKTREAVATDMFNIAVSRLPEHFREFSEDTLVTKKGDILAKINAPTGTIINKILDEPWEKGYSIPAPDPERIKKAVLAIGAHRKAGNKGKCFFLFEGRKEDGTLLNEKALRFLGCLSGRGGEFRIAPKTKYSDPIVAYRGEGIRAVFMSASLEGRNWVSDDVCVL